MNYNKECAQKWILLVFKMGYAGCKEILQLVQNKKKKSLWVIIAFFNTCKLSENGFFFVY